MRTPRGRPTPGQRRRPPGLLLLALLLSSGALAHAEPVEHRVVIVAYDTNDVRLPMALDAIAFWNDVMEDLGLHVRLVRGAPHRLARHASPGELRPVDLAAGRASARRTGRAGRADRDHRLRRPGRPAPIAPGPDVVRLAPAAVPRPLRGDRGRSDRDGHQPEHRAEYHRARDRAHPRAAPQQRPNDPDGAVPAAPTSFRSTAPSTCA